MVFLGHSAVWGYGLAPSDAIPAQFQRFTRDSAVFNFAFNGAGSGSAYLTTKLIADSVDQIYLFPLGEGVHPVLAKVIPIDATDRLRFGLTATAPLETGLARTLGFWNLYRYSHRLQVALFASSMRVYLYDEAKARVRQALRGPSRAIALDLRLLDCGRPLPYDAPIASARPSGVRVAALAGRYPFLWEYAALIQSSGRRVIVVDLDHAPRTVEAADRADLNAYWNPAALFVELKIPEDFRTDSVHLSPAGACAVAKTLFRHTLAPAGRG